MSCCVFVFCFVCFFVQLAGHESLETTMKYIHLNESESEARLKQARHKLREDTVLECLSLGVE